MGKMGVIGESIELIQEEAEKGLKTAAQQITGKTQGQQKGSQTQSNKQQAASTQTQKPPVDQGKPAENVPADLKQLETQTQAQTQDPTKTFVKALYGSTPEITQADIEKKKLEDKQKEETLRQQLHGQYYQNLTKPQKQQEERAQEKIGREEEEKKEALVLEEQKKKKEELPHIVTKDEGSKEKLRGVSG